MKRVSVWAHEFDSLPGHITASGEGHGCNLKSAFAGAVRNLLKAPQLKHKQFHSFKMSVVIFKNSVKEEKWD
jgi:hypothetical protein